jgi:hypothetical protein
MDTRTTTKTVARSDWRLATAISAILLASAPHDAAAQSANAALRGKAPASGEVVATNTETGLTRRTQVNEDGSYVLVGLPPGTYRVSAGGTEQVVSLGVASTSTLNFGGEQTPTALGEVTVSGNRLAEVRTSEVGGGISLRQIEVTPQITRNFLEFADAVPGMQFSVDANGNTQIRSGTLNTGTTNVYIDGVGQKNYVRPSGVTGQAGANPNQNTSGDPGNPFPQLGIAEYKVITSNYKAEYDQVSGAAITAVTKSGTNEFEAGAFMNLHGRRPPGRDAGRKGRRYRQGGRRQPGVRFLDRRSDHQGQDALLPHLRGQGVHGPQYRRSAAVCRRQQRAARLGRRADAGASGELRPGLESLRRGPHIREARLGTRLLRSPRAVGQVPRRAPTDRRCRLYRRIRGIDLRQ